MNCRYDVAYPFVEETRSGGNGRGSSCAYGLEGNRLQGGQMDGPRCRRPSVRGDRPRRLLPIWYFCLCGWVALVLDVAQGQQVGAFTVAGRWSALAMVWMAPVGIALSLLWLFQHSGTRAVRAAWAVLSLVYACAWAIALILIR